ncbi:uncharacterized protein LOC105192258 isoform X2 [Harpegnathos saltator]|uniref:Small RNA 2'-O-methyltransferase n=2 Tax=Harpegnathos saltator TaxID=610380 RepID=E2B8I9_HARSA|nr:uncharacterized protein LOC105192258 isoform X2 [Harpegnathos saltator]EFN87975.1 UPF0486 protein C1orf59 [Harpegnathos saltator]
MGTPWNDAGKEETADRRHILDDNKVQDAVDDTQPLSLVEVSQTVKFSPPAYIQRYLTVASILHDPKYGGKLRKVVDFGCAELAIFPYLKHIAGIEEILFVDIDRVNLLLYKDRVKPLIADHLKQRQGPLKIEICVGNVVQSDKKLEKTDVVLCIELIEHLHDYTLFNVPANIFEYIRPKLAIITTPNADFNVLFPNLSGGFRHPDHKFEWTREYFEHWARNIVRKYPNYTVSFHGICYGPVGTEHLGACTQMAIFERKQEPIAPEAVIEGLEGFFETIEIITYPFNEDKRTDTEKLVDEAKYYINFLAHKDEESLNLINLAEVNTFMSKYSISLETLREILYESGYIVEDREEGPVIILSPEEPESESEFEEDYIEDNLDFEDEENITEFYDMNEDEFENDNDNFYEESIVIVENQIASNEENSYLYDWNEHSIDHHHSQVEESVVIPANEANIPRFSNREGPVEIVRNVPNSAANAIQMDDVAEIDDVAMLGIATSLQATLQNVDMNSSNVQDNYDVINFQPYMSVSRSSTSPGLLFNPELDDSLISQNLLNSTFNKTEIRNKADIVVNLTSETPSSEIFPMEMKNEDLSEYVSPNDFKINYIDNIMQDNVGSTESRVLEEDRLEAELQNIFRDIHDEPQSTSSPRCKKIRISNAVKRSCLEGDDLISALESYTELNPMEMIEEVVSDISALKGTNQRSSYNDSAVTEIINCPAISDNENAVLKCEIDANCSSSNNSQRELCLGNKGSCSDHSTFVSLLQEDDNEDGTAGKDNLIKHETEIVDVQRIEDIPHVLPSDDVYEEHACGRLNIAEIISHNDNVETYLKHGSEDLANPNVNGKNSIPLRELSNTKSCSNNECSSVCAKEDNGFDDSFKSCYEDTNNKVVQFASSLKSNENVGCDTKDLTSKDVSASSSVGFICSAEARPLSPTFETPPDSWSHEIVDSGYPNSTSGQDITPENDLSSIAQDHIPDTESPSVAEAPRFELLDLVEVENGDLANNNRDNEGNNMVAADANDIEGLQPFIAVLENDLENENDIYVLENDFPIWLLRILDMANPLDFEAQPEQNLEVHDEVADVHFVNHDEGFDSSSSDE